MVSTEDMTKEERLEFWRMVMEEFRESGKNKTAYCQDNDIPISTFNYWENRVKEAQAEQEMKGHRFVELIPPAEPENGIRQEEMPGRAGCDIIPAFAPELVVSCEEFKIMVNSDTPMPLLHQVLQEVRHAV